MSTLKMTSLTPWSAWSQTQDATSTSVRMSPEKLWCAGMVLMELSAGDLDVTLVYQVFILKLASFLLGYKHMYSLIIRSKLVFPKYVIAYLLLDYITTAHCLLHFQWIFSLLHVVSKNNVMGVITACVQLSNWTKLHVRCINGCALWYRNCGTNNE